MRKTLALVVLSGVFLGTSVHGAAAAPARETIHLKAPAGMSMLAKAMGVASVTYSAKDVSVRITADHLPAVSSVHGSKFYVAWLRAGSKSWFLGDLKMTGTMEGASGMLMIKTFQNIAITAEKTAHPMHAMGTLVLSGNSMRH